MRFYLSLVSCFDGKSREKKRERERKRRKEKVIGNIRAAAPFVPQTNFFRDESFFFLPASETSSNIESLFVVKN